ncbi:hypothetical protein QFZ37_003152 [Chryseobacterium ginsenosidimutans]|uniref:hypothetical protein n=1 Tax=Chryseobacterium ginsenosidimutans TaxID=687846 RepID=UPI0027853D3A|nr:hypothetical protein [Chryseobacterium ginsenosidimutans]MDQ0594783.1 hypothetical protein [Chryseobacterium ginsenosidimutans]
MRKHRNIVLIMMLFSIISCKKINFLSQIDNVQQSPKQKNIKFKEFGNPNIQSEKFPTEWKINTYDDESTKISKSDEEVQKKFESLDYFKNLKTGKNSAFLRNSSFVKKDSLLNLAKIDSLTIIDSTFVSNKDKIFYAKTIATLDDGKSEFPIGISRLDMILVEGNKVKNAINLYSETDYSYLTKQKNCYIDKNGAISCVNFIIDETKVSFKGSSKLNAKKIFNLK